MATTPGGEANLMLSPAETLRAGRAAFSPEGYQVTINMVLYALTH